jgi:hypothetical protein
MKPVRFMTPVGNEVEGHDEFCLNDPDSPGGVSEPGGSETRLTSSVLLFAQISNGWSLRVLRLTVSSISIYAPGSNVPGHKSCSSLSSESEPFATR